MVLTKSHLKTPETIWLRSEENNKLLAPFCKLADGDKLSSRNNTSNLKVRERLKNFFQPLKFDHQQKGIVG